MPSLLWQCVLSWQFSENSPEHITLVCKNSKSGTTEKLQHSSHNCRYFCSSKDCGISQELKKKPGFFVQKMKRKWWWDSGSKASLTVCRYDYIWSIIGLNFWRLFEGKGSNQCLHGCREEWEEGMDESRCIILELEWIPVLLSSILTSQLQKKWGNYFKTGSGGGEKSCLNFLKRRQ